MGRGVVLAPIVPPPPPRRRRLAVAAAAAAFAIGGAAFVHDFLMMVHTALSLSMNRKPHTQ
jgi:hypothetical protein